MERSQTFTIPKISNQAQPTLISNPLKDEDIFAPPKIQTQKSKDELKETPPDEKEPADPPLTVPTFEDKILTDVDLEDIKRAADNPKLITMIKHIENLVDKTQKARHELHSMIQISKELKDQCQIQNDENAQIEVDQKRINDDLNELKLKVVQLSSEKNVLEKKLEELRLENDELEAFLQQAADENQDTEFSRNGM